MLGRNKNIKVICVGSACKDIFFPTDGGIVLDTPEDIESQQKIAFEQGAKYQVDDRFEAPGGVAANVSQGLARLGVRASCYSRIGMDVIGDWIFSELKSGKVDTSLMQREKECKSDLSAIIVDKNTGERVIFFNRDSNEKLEVHEEDFKKGDWIFISALNGDWKGNLRKILRIAEDNSIKLAFNPGQRNIKDDPSLIAEAIAKSEVTVLNKDEAIGILSAQHSFSSADELNDEEFLLRQLKSLGGGVLVLTDGTRGSWVYDGSNIIRRESIHVDALDSTGAGDAFTSAFLAAYVKGLALEESARWGALNSNSVVLYYGCKEGLLYEKDIRERSEELDR